MSLSNLELLALAVLKGDRDAACALCDLVKEEWSDGAERILPVQKITAPLERVRAVAFMKEGWVHMGLREQVADWLAGRADLDTRGMERIELYELPEPEAEMVVDESVSMNDFLLAQGFTPGEIHLVEDGLA